MASIKVASLLLKSLAKPIANRLKQQAKEHERFRAMTISLAQFTHRSEMKMRVNLLGETGPAHIRPLNDAKAVDSGAQFVAESFLFAVGAGLIFAESWRSSRKEQARRDGVKESITELQAEVARLKGAVDEKDHKRENLEGREKELEKIVEEIVGIGLRGGWMSDQHKSSLLNLKIGETSSTTPPSPVVVGAEAPRS